MLPKILFFVFANIVVATAKGNKSECEHENKFFGDQSLKFVECVLEHNEKATFCLDCKDKYSNFMMAYNRLLVNCSQYYFGINQLNIVDTVYKSTNSLWNSGFCSDCYVACDFANTTADCPLSNRTNKFKELYDSTQSCISLSETYAAACHNCSKIYTDLSNFYNTIRMKTADKFCFAIKDMMNKTQILWSKEMHCCEDRKSSLLDFLTLSGSSIAVSILFYISIYLFGLRSERIQCIPDDLMPPNHESGQSNGTIMNINHEEPSTSELTLGNNSGVTKLIAESGDSSSDDESLLVSNPNLIQI